MLSARDVCYLLPDGRELFANLSLDVVAGEAVVIEGPSGTGKSTLLALLGGIVTPTSGHVAQDSGWDAPFAWVLQTLNGLGARSVLANVVLLARLDGGAEDVLVARARDLLSEVGLGGRERVRSRLLSGGELQRMTVARALASSRPIILADEPTNQLDRDNARRIMRMLVNSARSEGRVVVVVTHDHDALPTGCRVLALTPQGLIDRSASR